MLQPLLQAEQAELAWSALSNVSVAAEQKGWSALFKGGLAAEQMGRDCSMEAPGSVTLFGLAARILRGGAVGIIAPAAVVCGALLWRFTARKCCWPSA